MGLLSQNTFYNEKILSLVRLKSMAWEWGESTQILAATLIDLLVV